MFQGIYNLTVQIHLLITNEQVHYQLPVCSNWEFMFWHQKVLQKKWFWEHQCLIGLLVLPLHAATVRLLYSIPMFTYLSTSVLPGVKGHLLSPWPLSGSGLIPRWPGSAVDSRDEAPVGTWLRPSHLSGTTTCTDSEKSRLQTELSVFCVHVKHG